MGVLVIGLDEQEKIKQAIAKAKANPMPLSALKEVAIDDRKNPKDTLSVEERDIFGKLEEIKRKYPSYHVRLGNYTAAISFEEQPNGLTKHLSVSTHAPGKVPNEPAMQMISEAFGFSGWPPIRPYRLWVEEYEPGRKAINLVEIE